jgi:hypothetical protein
VTPPAGDQLALALGPFVNRKLFSDHFLRERLPLWPEFADAAAAPLIDDLADLWDRERAGLTTANEAQTEERFIKPVLTRLGFSFTVQAGVVTAGGHRQPDYALFVDDAARVGAETSEGADRYRGAVAVCDAKRFDRPLDRRRVRGALSEDPVAQIIHYVAVTRRRWGILTNGRLWRLYAAEGDMVEGACLEFDLCALLDARDPEAFRYFAALFTADAFVRDADGRALLDRALDGSRAQAVDVGEALRRQVFAAVPLVAEGLLGGDERTPEALIAAFDNALVVLYRLLFCLHAEDRGLLPVDGVHYRAYSLREHRRALARDRDAGRVFSPHSDDKYNDLRALFRIVDRGDTALGVNEYDGGLFSASAHPWLHGRSVPDDLMVRALDLLYRVDGEQVDYRDLSVRHLGTIFEHLLAFRLAGEATGPLRLASADGRKRTGAFFTPEHVVDDIVERTLGPLFDERSREAARAGKRALDVLLDLHVLDPAMGSGHFLVGAAAYLARRVANDPSYQGDLTLAELQGLIAERCLYGVDVNPMAVEVARLALWLSTVRDDRPLRFLGNLRAGNSLVAAELRALLEGETDLFASELASRAEKMLNQVGELVRIHAVTGDEAHVKEDIAADLDSLRAPLLAECDAGVAPPVSAEAGRPFHWELEFPERFLDEHGRIRADAGFDAVIGNPPYVRIQELGRDVAAHCRARYATAYGSFDAYVPFIERGLNLLRTSGRLGYIVPNKFLKLDYAQRLRARLADDQAVETIIDFGHAQVFEGATNYTCILVLDRQGAPEASFVALRGSATNVRAALAIGDLPPAERYATSDLGAEPWVLVGQEERGVIDAMRRAGPSLAEVTEQIFQGLITSADAVYILKDGGMREGRRVVIDRDGNEFELEPDLLHSLASGAQLERYALRKLDSLLLFPYVRGTEGMRLMQEDELVALPRTWEYLSQHEDRLRSRERGKMDRDGWWGYVYPKNLAAHDRPKLCVPRLCARLRASADPNGEAYLDNVDVNGVLPAEGEAGLFRLCAVLNSRVADWAFRRGSVPFQSGFWSANKQFIAWLPVPDATTDLDELGRSLHDAAKVLEDERGGWLEWLSSVCGVPLSEIAGHTKLSSYAVDGRDAVFEVLDKNASRLSIDPRSRAHRELIGTELDRSAARIAEHRETLRRHENEAESCLADAYGLTAAQRARIESEYSPRPAELP